MTTFSEGCAAISFHGIETTEESLAGFYHLVVQWFNELGYPPDNMSVHGPGHSGRPVSFARTNAKVEKMGFGGITSLSVSSLIPDARIPVNDFLLTADWSARNSYALIVSRSSIASLTHTAMLPLAQKIIHDVKPAYGIGYKRDHRLGPAMYAVGICQGLGPGGYGVEMSPAEEEEAESISRWNNGMAVNVWTKGLLRDVYPWNFLSRPHLAKQVEGVPLEIWIGQDAQRGTLSPIGKDITLWEVSEPDVPVLRSVLHKAELIFNWKKHL